MCTAIVAAGLGAVGSIMQGAAANSAAKGEAAAAEQNARIADLQAKDAVERGGKEELSLRRRLSILQGQQRAQAAASGLLVDTGSMDDIQYASMVEGERDATTNAMNHAREAWGYNVQATNYRNQASSARAAGKNAMFSGILGAGGSLLSLAAPNPYRGSGSTLKIKPNQYSSPIGPMDIYDSSKIKNPRWA